MDKAHHIQDIQVNGEMLTLKVDGKAFSVNLCEQSSRLAAAGPAARKNIEVSPSGYGLHWPDADEDLSVDGLIGIRHEAPDLRATA